MQRTDHVYQAYCEILRRELTAASGCTEPIALAYCAAKARQTLGTIPERVRVQVSGNIIKNVKSVTVPNTGGLRGIPAAVAASSIVCPFSAVRAFPSIVIFIFSIFSPPC